MGKKLIVLSINKNHLYWFVNYQMLLWWDVVIPKVKTCSVGDITFIEDISTKYFCDPRHFLLVHLLNSWFLFVHSSSFIMVLKIAKRLFEGRGEMARYVRPSDMFCLFKEIYWSVFEAAFNMIEECSVWLCRNIRKVLFLQYVFN